MMLFHLQPATKPSIVQSTAKVHPRTQHGVVERILSWNSVGGAFALHITVTLTFTLT